MTTPTGSRAEPVTRWVNRSSRPESVDGTAHVVDKSGAGAAGEDQVTRVRIGR
ncbi:hypothetical protein OG252_47980 [Streptomyces sp. NBC_01352]|uniref:hypothetical protein n=1 Tax=Streptomyces sp. NBC_01352 TaxID=2903834 RepID=UPI002E313358|nr:hypothetical protein [Streptomyces sp. NBC_01352]